MTLPGVDCGSKNVLRKGNVVHSVDEAANGTGAMVFPHNNKKTCYRISGIAAYKCTQLGVLGAFATQNVEMTDVIGIDNGHGVGAMVHGHDENVSYGSNIIEVKTFGDFKESLDCPEKGGFCHKITKGGFFAGTSGIGEGI